MYSSVTVIEAPAVEPVTLDMARAHCRVDSANDDEMLSLYITTARELAEAYLNRALITQTLMYVAAQQQPPGTGPYSSVGPIFILPLWFNWADLWQQWLDLPRAPIQSVTSISLGQWGQSDTMLVYDTDYEVDVTMQPGRVRLLNNGAIIGSQNHLAVTYIAGYGDTPAAVPAKIRLGILWWVAYLYENRGDVGVGVPEGIERLLSVDRLVTFG